LPLFGSPNVEKLIERRDCKRLARALSDDDATIRDRAARGLITIRDPASVPFVVDVLLADQQEAVLDAGVHVLREMGVQALPTLVHGLRSGQPPEKRAGYAGVLGRLGPESGLQPLLEASRDPEPEMRKNAAMGLGLVGDPRAQERLAEMVSADNDMEARGIAGFAMATHKLAGAYETLLAQLDSDDPASRGMSATNLGILGDRRATQRLEQLVERDADQRVCDAARRALASLQQ
jgi:HEAT repeat protein